MGKISWTGCNGSGIPLNTDWTETIRSIKKSTRKSYKMITQILFTISTAMGLGHKGSVRRKC